MTMVAVLPDQLPKLRAILALERIGSPEAKAILAILAADGDTYKYKVLWRFNGTDGAFPQAYPFLNKAGDLLGVTFEGGSNSSGTMFEVKP